MLYAARFACLIALFLMGRLASAQLAIPMPGSPEQAVQYANSAVDDPLAPDATDKRQAAFKYLENDHNVGVLLCSDVVHELNDGPKTKASREVFFQYAASAGTAIYANPSLAKDMAGQNLAGITAALHVYQQFVSQDKTVHIKFMDKAEAAQQQDKLPEFIAKHCK